VSYHLLRRVRKYFDKLQKSAVLSGKKISKNEYIAWKKNGGEPADDSDDDDSDDDPDENDGMKKIPNSFHQLTNDHFPLFVTYKKFSEMIQGTTHSWAHFVNYKLFKTKYWPRISARNRTRLDCELVYSEFSIIKVC
jgi:hypothetical protein